ncbi:MAG: PTS sugar transporter subunit IIC [Clostridium sp.]|uniref:PTS sugar transporter subunit IIC n=1 Tax=Clostridium sp. TaxID=1506 RepID=UPI003F3F7C27
MKIMDKLASGLEKFLMPVAERLGRQKQLCAIRDGFIATLAISMAGAVGSLLKNVLFQDTSILGEKLNTMEFYAESIQPFLTKYMVPFTANMWWGTIALTTIFLVITIAYSLGRAYDVDPLATALVCLAAFFTIMPDVAEVAVTPEGATEAIKGMSWGMIHYSNFNSTAMFTGMLVAIIGAQIFIWFTKKGFTIKMPEQVPPAVSKAFAAVVPAVIVVGLAGMVYAITYAGVGTELKVLIEKAIQEPLMALGQSPVTYIALATLSQFLWFFGLHGLNMIEPALNTMYKPPLMANLEAVQAGGEASFTLTRNFIDVYGMPGGSGGTLALLIAIFIFSKRQESRELAKLAIAPGLFNINEPVIFGLPLVLNPMYFIPFVITPGICIGIAYFFTEVVQFADRIYIDAGWIMPPVISAVITTGGDIKAGILSAGLILLAVLIWTPFVIAANKVGNDN